MVVTKKDKVWSLVVEKDMFVIHTRARKNVYICNSCGIQEDWKRAEDVGCPSYAHSCPDSFVSFIYRFPIGGSAAKQFTTFLAHILADAD